MNTQILSSHKPQSHTRIYNPAVALRDIIDNLGSATPWAMFALCSMAPETNTRRDTRPPMRTVSEPRVTAPRTPAC